MHLVRPVGEAQQARRGEDRGERSVGGDARRAVHLHRLVGDLLHRLGHERLDDREEATRLAVRVAARVHQLRRLAHEVPHAVDVGAALRDAVDDGVALGERLAKGNARLGARAHERECALGLADGAHAVVDAAGAQPPLRNLEALAFAPEDGGLRHTAVLERDLHVALWRVGVAKHGQRPHEPDAGRVHRHEEHGLLLVEVRVFRVRLAHQNHDLRVQRARAGAPPFAAVDDVVAPLLADGDGNVGRVARRDVRLRHREAGADLALEKRLEPPLLLLVAAKPRQRLHVARVRAGRVCRLRRHLSVDGRAHDLAEVGVLQVGQPGAVPPIHQQGAVHWQEEVPEPRRLCLGHQLHQQRRVHPLRLVCKRVVLPRKLLLVRVDLGVHKLDQPPLERLVLRLPHRRPGRTRSGGRPCGGGRGGRRGGKRGAGAGGAREAVGRTLVPLGNVDAQPRHGARHLAPLRAVGGARLPVERPLVHALEDGGHAEAAKGAVVVEVRSDGGEAGRADVRVNQRLLRRDARRRRIGTKAGERLWPCRRRVVRQRGERQIGGGVAERRQLPVEHRDHLGRIVREDAIVDAQVAMHKRGQRVVAGGQRLRQPREQLLKSGVGLRLRGTVLRRPHLRLPRHVASLLPKVAKPGRLVVNSMQRGDRRQEAAVQRAALLGRGGGAHLRVVEEAARDVVAHQEGRAEHLGVVAEHPHRGHRHRRRAERRHAAEFAIDGVGAAEELARRLLAEHQSRTRLERQQVRRVRLTVRELRHGDLLGGRTDRAGVREEGQQLRDVELVALPHARCGGRERLRSR
mmetsp:Transcript_14695/g.47184  ORF Transcript_14695/g.47184 Transcript_14695/m.47184 type:complete len:801 (-) Transcript_14695:62-2464(-)